MYVEEIVGEYGVCFVYYFDVLVDFGIEGE